MHAFRQAGSILYSADTKGYNAKITRILATNNGAYISTLGGGLFFYDKKTHKTAHYTAEEHQLPSNFCYNVCLSPSGNILITSDKGVTSYSPEKQLYHHQFNEKLSNSPHYKWLRHFRLRPKAHLCGRYQRGNSFSEEEFHKANTFRHNPNLYFSELWINNQKVVAGDETEYLPRLFHILKSSN